MNAKIYSVKDELNQKFLQPFFIENGKTADQEATRIFQTNINNIPLWRDNASDYSLYAVGEFDDETGYLNWSGTTPEKITSGHSLLRKEN